MSTPEDAARAHIKQVNAHVANLVRAGHGQVASTPPATAALWEAADAALAAGIEPRVLVFGLARATGAIVAAAEKSFGLDGAKYVEDFELGVFQRDLDG